MLDRSGPTARQSRSKSQTNRSIHTNLQPWFGWRALLEPSVGSIPVYSLEILRVAGSIWKGNTQQKKVEVRKLYHHQSGKNDSNDEKSLFVKKRNKIRNKGSGIGWFG